MLLVNTTDVTAEFIAENYNYSLTATTSDGTLNVNLTFSDWYRIDYDADGYHPRSYYLDLTESLQTVIDLYLLNESTDVSSRVVHHVFDESGNDAANVTISLQRNYGANYITVAMARTNFEGEAIFYVELYDVYYKLIYQDENHVIVDITDPSPFMVIETSDKINLEEDAYLSWKQYDEAYYNLSFVNVTGTTYFRFIWIDTTGIVRRGCLNVQQITTGGIFNVCENCTNASSATMTCLVDPNITGSYKAVALIDSTTDNTYFIISTIWYQAAWSKGAALAQEGVWFATMIIGTMGLLGIATVTGSMIFLMVGTIIAAIIGFTQGFTIGIIMSFVILGFIIIFMIRSGRR